MRLILRSVAEERPGRAWAKHFVALWPAYRKWYLCEGEAARPTYLACERALLDHMPEIVPLWRDLVQLSGGTDLAARCLSGYCPPPYMSGCSQAVWLRDEPMLVRNYDYLPELWEGLLLCTRWRGQTVLGMSDCLWGILDGMNESGLSVSLAFGGRRDVGVGFGIPIVLRYVLEVCKTVPEAVAVLKRVPCHMAYTVTLVDPSGAHATVFLAPGKAPVLSARRVATNHQGQVHWPQHAVATGSVDRLTVLTSHLHRDTETAERFASRFLEPPTWSNARVHGWGTLYTALYWPRRRAMELRWHSHFLLQSLDAFVPGALTVIH